MKVAIVGLGYVGIANALLLAQHHNVIAYDICKKKVALVNAGKSPVPNHEIDGFLSNVKLSLKATTCIEEALCGADYVFIAIPTNFDDSHNKLDTSIVEQVISNVLRINASLIIVIKSTLPIGFTRTIKQKLNTQNIIYSPEFLREKTCLQDILKPSRIIVGNKSSMGNRIVELLMSGIENKETPILLTNPEEAEAIKLFSNAYLALRISFFNELDSFALT